MIKKGAHMEVTIEKLGLGGKGVAKIDDFVIFVDRTLPGQTVEIVITKKKKSYADGKVIKVIKQSEIEIPAKCEHFGKCGGCKWQTLPYKNQIEIKQNQLIESIEHIGKIDLSDTKVLDIVSSPKEYEYRNKVEFSFGYQKMWSEIIDEEKIFHDDKPALGFHKPGKWWEVVEINKCHLVDQNVNDVLNKIKEWAFSKNLDVYNPKSKKGFFRNVLVRENIKGELLINIIVNEKRKDIFFNDLIVNLKDNNIKSVYRTINDGMNDIWVDGDIKCIHGEPYIMEEVSGLKFQISPESFFQTNTIGAEKLYGVVKDFAKGKEISTILDLYCGTGTIGQIIAADNKETEIVGLELLESAVADAYINSELNGLNNVNFIAGKAEKTLPEVLEKYKAFDLVVIDPPRNGIHPKALKTILELMPKQIIYVSCNPATLARDLNILVNENNYKLIKIQAVDMFPHTAHIEVVVKLELSN